MTSLPKIKDISSLFGGLSVDDTSDIDSLIDSMEDISLERELPKNVYMLNLWFGTQDLIFLLYTVMTLEMSYSEYN